VARFALVWLLLVGSMSCSGRPSDDERRAAVLQPVRRTFLVDANLTTAAPGAVDGSVDITVSAETPMVVHVMLGSVNLPANGQFEEPFTTTRSPFVDVGQSVRVTLSLDNVTIGGQQACFRTTTMAGVQTESRVASLSAVLRMGAGGFVTRFARRSA